MPIYDFECPECGDTVEVMVPIAERDTRVVVCAACGARRRRVLITSPNLHGPAYQMKAVLSDGTEVPGHFGKSAKLRRK